MYYYYYYFDPFGHSSTHASLMARAGMDALYFGRIDYQDLQLRQLTRECEGLWSPTSRSNDTIFWGLTGSYLGNYGPPGPGLCFDPQCPGDERLVGLNATRLKQRIYTFLEDVRVQSDRTRGNHVMLTMGTDFSYSEAHEYFSNLDLLMGSITNFQSWDWLDIPSIMGPDYDRVNIFYSTPEYYTKMKFKETAKQHPDSPNKVEWAVKRDDFFPYSDSPHSFWTGYFTSRTSFKRFERVASSFLLAARQIESYWSTMQLGTFDSGPLFQLTDALGVVQHHDAVSGTAKQHVADDYSKRLAAGMESASGFLIQTLRQGMLDLENLMYCPLLNETVCEVSEQITSNETQLYVLVYNPLASEKSTIVRLPVSTESTYRVERMGTNNEQVATSVPVDNKYVLSFDTGALPAVGAATYRITMSSSKAPLNGMNVQSSNDVVVVSGNHLTVTLNASTGMIQRVATANGAMDMSQTWGYYTSFDHELDESSDSKQNSGAYIFRPSTPEQDITHVTPLRDGLVILNTSVGVEVHVSFSEPWIKQVTRVYKDQPFIEIEYTIGPVSIEDGRGKEIVTRYTTPVIKSASTFYTDSNGREFLQRRRNSRPSWALDTFEPVAGNYYPVNAAIYIEDSKDAAALAVLLDRSQGGTSLKDGSIELMVQRRTVADDGRGVDEPLNETCGGTMPYPPYGDASRVGEGVVIRGVHRIMVDKGTGGARLARSMMDRVYAEPLVFVGSISSDKAVNVTLPTFSALQTQLPPNVMLMTFAKVHSRANTYLVRLGHQYALNEDAALSKSVEVDFSSLFAGLDVVHAIEKTLSGNQNWTQFQSRRLDWVSGNNVDQMRDPSDLTVTLDPLDIKTFHVIVAETSIVTSQL
jgi:hypothetical protein